MNEEELLLHYGVKGMKWGVRRSRTSKGSVTKRIGESAKDYGKTYKKTVKDSFVNPRSQTKAEFQLLKEKPRTALYRTKADLKRLNELTDSNASAAAAKKAKNKQSAKDYGTEYKKTVKDSFVNSKSQTKAELQLLKEKPRTALYRNKDDLKRLNQLTSENVAKKTAKREASKSYKEAKALDRAAKNAKRKETASKIGRELLAINNDMAQDKKMAAAISKIDSSLDKGMADIMRNAVYEETQKRKSEYRKAVGR